MLDERRHVGQPLAQRRDAQRVDVEAIVEVLTEAARLDLALEIAIGGRDDARRDRDGPVAADAHHLPLFEHAQQLGLRRQRQLADLVEEQRASCRRSRTRPGAGDRRR